MRKPKFLMKVDSNNLGKVYINKKWQKDVYEIDVYGVPMDYRISISQYVRDSSGKYIVENDEIKTKTTKFDIRANWRSTWVS